MLLTPSLNFSGKPAQLFLYMEDPGSEASEIHCAQSHAQSDVPSFHETIQNYYSRFNRQLVETCLHTYEMPPKRPGKGATRTKKSKKDDGRADHLAEESTDFAMPV